MNKYFSRSLVGLFLTIAVLQLVPVRSMYLFNALPQTNDAAFDYDETTKPPISRKPPTNYVQISLNESMRSFDITVRAGQRLVLECGVKAMPRPEVFWSKFLRDDNGNEVEKVIKTYSSHSSKWSSKHNDSRASHVITRYVIECVTSKDRGIIGCGGGAGKVRKVVKVKINVADTPAESCEDFDNSLPVITNGVKTIIGYIGEDRVKIPCSAVGPSIWRILWAFNNQTINEGPGQITNKRWKINGDSLSIIDLKWEDMGIFTCVVQSTYGNATSSTFVYPLLLD